MSWVTWICLGLFHLSKQKRGESLPFVFCNTYLVFGAKYLLVALKEIGRQMN